MSSRRSPASRYPIEIPKGADFAKVWVYYPDGVDEAPKDWTGSTGKAQLRAKSSPESLLLEFDVSLGSDGSVEIAADHEATEDLAPGNAVWDLYITNVGGSIDRFLAGPATITRQVTHD